MLLHRQLLHRLFAFAILLVVATGAAPAGAQNNAKEILAKEPAQLIAILESPDASEFEKAKACQRLGVVGTAEAVPALAALLNDEKLSLYARFGLESIADPAAGAALREAAGKLQGRQLVGVLNSLGRRCDEQAVELLAGFLTNADAAVAAAAAGALGHVGTSEAAAALQDALAPESAIKLAVADACLACAEALAAADQKDQAVALLQTVAKADVPKHLQIAALRGQFPILQGEAKDLLLAQIRAEDEAFFHLGLAMARQTPGEETTAALLEAWKTLPPPRQALLLLALGDRPTPPPSALLLEASQSQSADVREAAIRVLSHVGDASAVTILLDAALDEGDIAASAKAGLTSLTGEEVDQAIVARLKEAAPQDQAVLFELIGARRVTSAAPTVRQALGDSNAAVRSAALAAYAQLVELKDLDLLIDRALASGPAAETEAARAALRTAALRMSDREGAATKLAAHLRGAPAAQQSYLLELLSQVSGPKALEAVTANAQSANPETKDAATRVLGEWPNADAAPALLDLAKNDREAKYQIRALRGYLRIARQLQLPNAERLAMFRTAMQVARRDEEKQLAMDVLTRIPSAQTLQLAVGYLDDPVLKDTAVTTALKIAPKVVAADPKAVLTAMQKVVAANPSGESAAQAKRLLEQARAGSQ